MRVDFEKILGACRADPADADTNIYLLVEQYRLPVLDDRLDQMKVDSGRCDGTGIVNARCTHIFCMTDIEIGQVVRVEDDGLSVNLCVPNANGMMKLEVAAGHEYLRLNAIPA
jgi:hypothetical protein